MQCIQVQTNRRLYLFTGADDCDFDYDEFCHWSDDQSRSSQESFQGLLGTGSTPSSSTEPSADHTSGAGTI